jgi:hypothetical protein
MNDDLIERLQTRASIRRKMRLARDGVGKDRISDLLDEAANEIISLSQMVRQVDNTISSRFDSDREIVNERY